MHKVLVHAQHSCACTTFLCMHRRGQGPRPGPKRKRRRSGPGRRFVVGPGLGPWPLRSCTRVLCIHKSVVHAQACCACRRILCMHNNLDKQTVTSSYEQLRAVTSSYKQGAVTSSHEQLQTFIPPTPPPLTPPPKASYSFLSLDA